MTTPVVVDTNILVAGLITTDSEAPVRRILDSMLAAELRYAVSRELLADYRRVLLRPAVMECHRLTESQVDEVLTHLALEAIVVEVEPGEAPQAQESDNQVLWDLLHRLDGPTLVSGDLIVLVSSSKYWTSSSPEDLLSQRDRQTKLHAVEPSPV